MSLSSRTSASVVMILLTLLAFVPRVSALPLTHTFGSSETRFDSRVVSPEGGILGSTSSDIEADEVALIQDPGWDSSKETFASKSNPAGVQFAGAQGASPMPSALVAADMNADGLGQQPGIPQDNTPDSGIPQENTPDGGFPHNNSPGWAQPGPSLGTPREQEDSSSASAPVIQQDIFPQQYDLLLFNAASSSEWTVLLSTVGVLLLLELFVFRPLAAGGNLSVSSHLCLLCFWIAAGMSYNAYFAFRYGRQDAIDWFTGYWLEWMLCVDNLFVFHLIFQVYKTPPDQMLKALFVGILGAVFFKLIFFFALGTLMTYLHWVRVLFGCILIWSGIQAVRESGDVEIEQTWGVRALKLLLGDRLLEKYDDDGRAFVVGEDGRLRATMLCYVVLCLEVTDVIFAVDSVSAKIAVIPNLYIAFSSSVLATFALRAQYFVIRDLVDHFTYLKYGLCFILVFLGVNLVFAYWIHLDSVIVCAVIFVVFAACILASCAERQGTVKDSQNSSLEAPKATPLDGECKEPPCVGAGAASELLPHEAQTCRL